ncbi:MAG TPA: GNAT family N-acetyltransferase [Pyrinomonadaceae bacterium]|jgi:GNAT superfamily N-acetyltransferase|nr:GNAT family N-acetyltransferase [Pyrinomonadaceae bacterium]
MSAKNDSQSQGIRRAVAIESATLTELALRSKAHWGYDTDFLEKCRAELTLSPPYITENHVFVVEESECVIGFYSLKAVEDYVELDHLFVEPGALRRGYGKSLWQHAVETASRLGYSQIVIQSDPHAEAFYQAMGATRFALAASSISPERMLPMLRFSLPAVIARVGKL